MESAKKHYDDLATQNVDSDYANKVAQAFGYSAQDLASAPSDTHRGLACGNPTGAASLKEGEVVVDLGCGGGLDCQLAAKQISPSGCVVGLDASSNMVNTARENASTQGLHPPHFSIVQTDLESELPLKSDSVNCIMSNCVINLLSSAAKASLFKELFRVLAPGGRLCIDDIVAKKDMPDAVRNDLASHVGCFAGALSSPEYEAVLREAGFQAIVLRDNQSDLSVYFDESQQKSCCTKSSVADVQQSPFAKDGGLNVNDYAGAYTIFAVKEATAKSTPLKASPLKNWWDAFPKEQSKAEQKSVEEVLQSRKEGQAVIVDVRTDDEFAAGHVDDAVSRVAQRFWLEREEAVEQLKKSPFVAFYCGRSQGRGPRVAGWYQDALNEKGITSSKAVVLQGGYKAWEEHKAKS